MTVQRNSGRLDNLWDDAMAATMNEAERLVYRSNLLGSDKRITNYGGGNTSSKIMEKDPLTGQMAEVLWVKGSGGDVGELILHPRVLDAGYHHEDGEERHPQRGQTYR